MSVQPRFTPPACVVSATERPSTSASVNVELTSGLPHSLARAASSLKCSSLVFIASIVNSRLSVSVTVRATSDR